MKEKQIMVVSMRPGEDPIIDPLFDNTLDYNFKLCGLHFYGPVIIAGTTSDGELRSLSPYIAEFLQEIIFATRRVRK